MAGRSFISPIELSGWTGGLNREADPYQLEPQEVPEVLNIDFGLRGDVSKRKGYTSYATSTNQIIRVENWTTRVVAVDDSGQVGYVSASAFTSNGKTAWGTPATAREYAHPMASMNDFLYMTRHEGITPVKWDGATWTDVAATVFDGTASRFPQARTLLSAHNRFFAGNVLDGGVARNSRLYFSELLDPETWDALDYFDISPDDGQEIVHLQLVGDMILIFKDRSIHAMVGTNSLEFDVFPLDQAYGTTSPMSVASEGTRLYFYDNERGVYAYDGAEFMHKSEKINTYLLDGINSTVPEKVLGWWHRNRYYLSVPWGVDTVNSKTFVYDPRLDSWTEYDVGFSDATHDAGMPVGSGVRDSTGLMNMWTSQADDGADIEAGFKTAWLAPKSPSIRHRLRRLDLTMSALGDYDVEVVMRRDFQQDAYKTQDINTDAGGAVYGTAVYGVDDYGIGSDQIMSRTSGWGDRWRVCQFEFSEDAQGAFQINRLIMQISSIRRSRGS